MAVHHVMTNPKPMLSSRRSSGSGTDSRLVIRRMPTTHMGVSTERQRVTEKHGLVAFLVCGLVERVVE